MNNYLVVSSDNTEKILSANGTLKDAEKFVNKNFSKHPDSEIVIYECKEIKTYSSKTELVEKK